MTIRSYTAPPHLRSCPQGPQEPGARGAVDHLVVEGERQPDRVDELDVAVGLAHGLEPDGVDAEDGHLGRVEHRGERLHPEAAQVGDGERAALRSSTPMVPATAWAASSFKRRARPTSDRSWASRTTGTTRPRSVSQAKPMWTAAWRYRTPSTNVALTPGASSRARTVQKTTRSLMFMSAVAGDAFIFLRTARRPPALAELSRVY